MIFFSLLNNILGRKYFLSLLRELKTTSYLSIFCKFYILIFFHLVHYFISYYAFLFYSFIHCFKYFKYKYANWTFDFPEVIWSHHLREKGYIWTATQIDRTIILNFKILYPEYFLSCFSINFQKWFKFNTCLCVWYLL